MYKGIIYKYTSPSGKVYIGLTINESKRKRTFRNINMKYSGGKIDNARKKYGPENFKYEVEVIVEKDNLKDLLESLNTLEILYIEKYNSFQNGYNSTLGGQLGGYIISEDRKLKARDKLSYKILQYDLDGNFIKIWNNLYEIEQIFGYNRETIRKCCRGETTYSNGFIWRYYQDNFPLCIEGLSLKRLKIINNMQPSVHVHNGRRLKRILQYDILGNFIKEWDSIKEAADFYNAKQNSISQCCNGVSKTCSGFVWKFYKENYPLKIEVNLTLAQILKAGKQSGMLRIYKYDLNMNLIDTYNSLLEAAIKNNISRTELISVCLSNKRYTCKNFIWKYGLELD